MNLMNNNDNQGVRLTIRRTRGSARSSSYAEYRSCETALEVPYRPGEIPQDPAQFTHSSPTFDAF
jgi:hypothetical protein